MELGTLLGSLTAIVMYAGRYVLTEVAMSKVKALRGESRQSYSHHKVRLLGFRFHVPAINC